MRVNFCIRFSNSKIPFAELILEIFKSNGSWQWDIVDYRNKISYIVSRKSFSSKRLAIEDARYTIISELKNNLIDITNIILREENE